eukprot:3820112-Amphidinium_carterae.1
MNPSSHKVVDRRNHMAEYISLQSDVLRLTKKGLNLARRHCNLTSLEDGAASKGSVCKFLRSVPSPKCSQRQAFPAHA